MTWMTAGHDIFYSEPHILKKIYIICILLCLFNPPLPHFFVFQKYFTSIGTLEECRLENLKTI